MSGDVLFTGSDDDLNFRDEWADTRTSLPLMAQQIETSLLVSRGEWIVDATQGIPWLDYTTNKRISLSQLREDVREAVQVVDGAEVDSIEVERDGRNVSIVLRVRRGAQTFVGTLVVSPERDRIGNNGYAAAFFPQFLVPRIVAR